MRNGIIYEGPSMLDGAPIVAIALWSTGNRKTGGMLQTYIIRSDMSPLEASKSGADKAICGTCPHRGKPTSDPKRKQAKERSCYVFLGQGPLIVWRSYERGIYPDAQGHTATMALGAGRLVRVGTYGDPAAVPDHVWQSLLENAQAWTAYTHASGWRPDIAMQSADSLEQAQAFWAVGSRTFRVVNDVSEIDASREVLCPASKEAGSRTTCAACKLCGGLSTSSPKSVAIPLH